MIASSVRQQLESFFHAALAGVEPGRAVHEVLEGGPTLRIAGAPVPEGARLVVVAAGKAAAPMAAALEEVAGDRIRSGIAVTKDGHGLPLGRIELREAAHPVPDARGEAAAAAIVSLVESADAEDVLLVLLSGGASALLPAPAPGLRLEDLVATNELLLASGAGIDAVNAVRKHTSRIAGGQLAARATAKDVRLLVISDVPGDRLDVIASGPCTADPSRYTSALEVLDAHGLRDRVPPPVREHLEAGARGERDETPKPGAPALERVQAAVVASNRLALEAAAREVRAADLAPVLLPGALQGEAREAGRALIGRARALRGSGGRGRVVIAGGETTVAVAGSGRGGRSQELALAGALALEGDGDLALLAAGTDGTDGPTDAAGAFADGGTVARGRAAGRDAGADLADNDSYGFFLAEGGLLRTGPTRTNVMDLAFVWLP